MQTSYLQRSSVVRGRKQQNKTSEAAKVPFFFSPHKSSELRHFVSGNNGRLPLQTSLFVDEKRVGWLKPESDSRVSAHCFCLSLCLLVTFTSTLPPLLLKCKAKNFQCCQNTALFCNFSLRVSSSTVALRQAGFHLPHCSVLHYCQFTA